MLDTYAMLFDAFPVIIALYASNVLVSYLDHVVTLDSLITSR